MLINIYRIVQYSLFIFLLATSSIHLSLKYIPHYEFYNDGTANLVLFAFISSEIVNVGWWINFIRHLKVWVDNIVKDNKRSSAEIVILFKRTKVIEIIGLVLIVFLFATYLTWNIFIIAYSFQDQNWRFCMPFYTNDGCDGSYCKNTIFLFNFTFTLLVWVGFLIILVKIITGLTLLYLMKNHLFVHYNRHYYQIILTTMWSCAILLNRGLYNIITEYRKWDIKFNFVAGHRFPVWQAPLQLFLTCFDILCLIGICLLNIKTINFEKYLRELMKACQLEKYWEVSSIFIRKNQRYDALNLHRRSSINLIGEDTTYNNSFNNDELSDKEERNDSYKSNFERIQHLNRTIRLSGKKFGGLNITFIY